MANVLIIEDDTTFAQIIEGFLLKNGFTVTLATSLNQAYKIVEQQEFDLLLFDYRLPDGTGIDADISFFSGSHGDVGGPAISF